MAFPIISAGFVTPLDPLNHASIEAVYDFQTLADVTTSPGGSPGVVTEVITDVTDATGNGYNLQDGGTNQEPTLEQDASGAYYAYNPGNDWLFYTGTMPIQTIIIGAQVDSVSAVFAGLVTDTDDAGTGEIHGVFRNEDDPPTTWGGNQTAGFDMGDGSEIFTDGVSANTIAAGTKQIWTRDTSNNINNTDDLTDGISLFRRELAAARFVRGRIYYIAIFDAILTTSEREAYEAFVANKMNISI